MKYKLSNKNNKLFSRRTKVKLTDDEIIIKDRHGTELITLSELTVVLPRASHVVPFQRFINSYIVFVSPKKGGVYRLAADDYYFEKYLVPLVSLFITFILLFLGIDLRLTSGTVVGAILLSPSAIRLILGGRNERVLRELTQQLQLRKVQIRKGVIDPYEFATYQKAQNFMRRFGAFVIAALMGFVIQLFAMAILATLYVVIVGQDATDNKLIFTVIISMGAVGIAVISMFLFMRFYSVLNYKFDTDVFKEIDQKSKETSEVIFREQIVDRRLGKNAELTSTMISVLLISLCFAVLLGFFFYSDDSFDTETKRDATSELSSISVEGSTARDVAYLFYTRVTNKEPEDVAALLCKENEEVEPVALVKELRAIRFDTNDYQNAIGQYTTFEYMISTFKAESGDYFTTLELLYVDKNDRDIAKYQIKSKDNKYCVYGLNILDNEYSSSDTTKVYLQDFVEINYETLQ